MEIIRPLLFDCSAQPLAETFFHEYIPRFGIPLTTSLLTHNVTNDWYDHLPLILLGIRTAVKIYLKCSPAEMLHGGTLRLPGDIFVPSDYLQ